MTPENAQLLERLAVALAIGLLMGLERGWEFRQLPEGGRVAGIRTFGIIALLGAIIVQIGGRYRELLLAAAMIAIALLMGIGYWRDTRDTKDVSITTPMAALVAFGLGAMAGMGQITLASSAAVVVTLILGFRIELHSLVAHIEREELTATLRLLLITVVVLPILPNRAMGPWQAFNPYQIWWMVVLIAGLSYVGYFANKFLGERRGLIVTGFFGGMTSSTAVTLTLSPIARERAEERPVIAAAILAASAIMFPRLLIITAAVTSDLALAITWPFLIAAALIGAGAGFLAWRSRAVKLQQSNHDLGTRNPLDLWFAVKFGMALSFIMVASRAAESLLGNQGLFGFAALSGLVDATPITLAASSMIGQGQVSLSSAAIALLIAAGVNTLVKPALMTFIAGPKAAASVWISTLIALVAGGAVAAWMLR
jgi:uncharacterized membrane protein (DUF4010 family)